MADILSPADQAALVTRLRSGDREAESEFVRLFWGRLRLMFIARIGDRDAARDLAQDAVLAALAELRAGSLRDDGRLAAFVYGVGRNVANNYLRREKGSPAHVPLQPDTLIDPGPSERVRDEERLRIAERAIGALPGDDREILLLTLVHGLKPGDIATRLGKSVEIVRTRKSRALKKLVAEVQRLSRSRADDH